MQHVVARNLKSVTDELALEKKVSELTDRMESLSAIVHGIDGRMVTSELMAKTAAAGVTELKAVTERSVVEISAAVKSGQEETTKLRKDVNDNTVKNKAASKDLFVQLFARLDEIRQIRMHILAS